MMKAGKQKTFLSTLGQHPAILKVMVGFIVGASVVHSGWKIHKEKWIIVGTSLVCHKHHKISKKILVVSKGDDTLGR